MIKFFGVFFLLILGGYTAWERVLREKRGLLVLDTWIALLCEIRNKIDCFSLPIDKILRDTDPMILARLGVGNRECSLAFLLSATRGELSDTSVRLLEGLLGELGNSYREEQVKRCDYYLKALENERNRIREALPGRIRLSVTLSVCATLGTVILLW